MAQLATSMEVQDPGGTVRLGEVALPGHVQRINVGCEVLYNEGRVPSRSGSMRQPQGYDDGQVTITLRFLDQPDGQSAVDQVAAVDRLFKSVDEGARPQVFRLVNVLTRARGIRDVQWKSFQSSGRVGGGGLEGELTLVEYKPPIIKKERAAAWKHGLAAGLAGGDELMGGGLAGVFGAATGAGLEAALAAGGGYLRDRKMAPYRRAFARGREARSIADRVLMKVPAPDPVEESDDVKRRQELAYLRGHRRM